VPASALIRAAPRPTFAANVHRDLSIWQGSQALPGPPQHVIALLLQRSQGGSWTYSQKNKKIDI
jgi:hypothetical protein